MFERHTFNGSTLVSALKAFYEALVGDLAKAAVTDVSMFQGPNGWTVVAFVFVPYSGKSE